jgi:hypothetical protein
MEYLAAHAGYTRVRNPVTGEKDLVRLPGLVAVAYQHETSRCGDPHLHTHVIVSNRQARTDGVLVSVDGTSVFHEAKAAGVIYQATLRRELHRSLGIEWAPVDPATGMAEIAGISTDSVRVWSRRSSQLRAWAANHLVVQDGATLSAAQLAAAQKATRPAKPEELAWVSLQDMWRADARGLGLDRGAFTAARAARRAAARAPFDRARLAAAAETIDKAAFTRADLVELIGAHLPIDTDRTPRELIEESVDTVAMRLTAPRAAHQREGHEKFTLDRILAEEVSVLGICDARDVRAVLCIEERHTAGLSPDQARAIRAIGQSPWLVQPLSAPAGAGKTTSLRALRAAAHDYYGRRVLVLAPTGRAVDVAVREGAGDDGCTVAAAIKNLREGSTPLPVHTLVVVDEAAMMGTDDLRELLAATTAAGVKTVLVGDAHQIAPVKARGGMFAQLCADLPWAQKLSEVWRMHDPAERTASLALRDGGPAPARRAVEWYRRHDRLRTGDPLAMATDALAGYRADVAAGKDALLVCDSTEMCDALNQRIHTDTLGTAAPTLCGARGHRVGVGDLIITRRNDPTIALRNTNDPAAEQMTVRNGQRWEVTTINPDNSRLAARRLDDHTLAVFDGGYVREHITHGYALTVHAAQGVTADTTHAVLGQSTTRSLLYVAMTRGRDTNTAYLYQRPEEQDEYGVRPEGIAAVRRGASRAAAHLFRAILGRDVAAQTAHDLAASVGREQLPPLVARLLIDARGQAVQTRRAALQEWRTREEDRQASREKGTDQHISRAKDESLGYGLEL